MPPEDELFPSSGESTPPAPKPNGEPPPVPTPSVVTEEQLAEVLRPITQQLGGMTQTQSQLTETLRSLQDVVGRLGLTGREEQEAEDALDPATFLADPAGSVAKIARQVMDSGLKEQVAPILSMGVEAIHNQAMEGMRNEIDSQWGSGTFEKEFLPELQPLIDRARRDAPSQLGDTGALRRTVDAVKGMKFERLVQLKKEHEEKQAAQREEERLDMQKFVTSNLPAGLVRTEKGGGLNEEGKAFLERIYRATGEQVNEKSFLASLNSGSTYEEWKAAQPEKK